MNYKLFEIAKNIIKHPITHLILSLVLLACSMYQILSNYQLDVIVVAGLHAIAGLGLIIMIRALFAIQISFNEAKKARHRLKYETKRKSICRNPYDKFKSIRKP